MKKAMKTMVQKSGIWKNMLKLAIQEHHLMTKYGQYGVQYAKILRKYKGLNLEGLFNKIKLPHAGPHPVDYHDEVLRRVMEIDEAAKGNTKEFLKRFKKEVTNWVRDNPEVIHKTTKNQMTMKYYAVKFSEEYARSTCKFGIVDFDGSKIEKNVVKDGVAIERKHFQSVVGCFDTGIGRVGADFQMSYFYHWRIISGRLFDSFSEFNVDGAQFFPLSIKHGRTAREYYLLHFPLLVNALNKSKSKYIGGALWSPVLNKRKLPSYDLFALEGLAAPSFCISESVQVQIKKQKLTGLSFKELEVA